jgi:hypothetical protein
MRAIGWLVMGGLVVACGDDDGPSVRLDAQAVDAAVDSPSLPDAACTPIGAAMECDPLLAHDFLAAAQPPCGCNAGRGCYGYPSYGTAPVTTFSCLAPVDSTLVHRSQVANTGINACAPGYLPLLRESATVSTTICVAICKPANCFAGNCGVNNENRLGVAPHRCTTTDRRGTFDNGANGEQCEFMWRREIDPMTLEYLPSRWKDTLGICFDHSKYMYDSDGDSVGDTTLPACADLQDGWGSGSDAADPLTYWGAADLGCVDSSRQPQMAKRPRRSPVDDLRPLFTNDRRN